MFISHYPLTKKSVLFLTAQWLEFSKSSRHTLPAKIKEPGNKYTNLDLWDGRIMGVCQSPVQVTCHLFPSFLMELIVIFWWKAERKAGAKLFQISRALKDGLLAGKGKRSCFCQQPRTAKQKLSQWKWKSWRNTFSGLLQMRLWNVTSCKLNQTELFLHKCSFVLVSWYIYILLSASQRFFWNKMAPLRLNVPGYSMLLFSWWIL